MSYILDALNKAEHERAMKKRGGLAAVSEFRREQHTKKTVIAGRILVGAAALLLLALPLVKIFRTPTPPPAAQNQQSPSAPIARTPVPAPAKEPVSTAVSVPQQTPPSQKESVPEVRNKIIRENPIARKLEAHAPTAPQPPVAAASVPKDQADAPAAVPATQEPPPPEASKTPALPLKEAIGKMAMTILVYNDNEADRKAYINGKKYVKGDLVDGLYLVESITAEGVWLRYGGQRALLKQ